MPPKKLNTPPESDETTPPESDEKTSTLMDFLKILPTELIIKIISLMYPNDKISLACSVSFFRNFFRANIKAIALDLVFNKYPIAAIHGEECIKTYIAIANGLGITILDDGYWPAIYSAISNARDNGDNATITFLQEGWFNPKWLLTQKTYEVLGVSRVDNARILSAYNEILLDPGKHPEISRESISVIDIELESPEFLYITEQNSPFKNIVSLYVSRTKASQLDDGLLLRLANSMHLFPKLSFFCLEGCDDDLELDNYTQGILPLTKAILEHQNQLLYLGISSCLLDIESIRNIAAILKKSQNLAYFKYSLNSPVDVLPWGNPDAHNNALATEILVEGISNCKKLVSLVFDGPGTVGFSEDGLLKLYKVLPHLKDLNFLSLRDVNYCGGLTPTPEAAAGIALCPKIVELDISKNDIEDEGLADILGKILPHLPHLANLNLSGILFGQKSAIQLSLLAQYNRELVGLYIDQLDMHEIYRYVTKDDMCFCLLDLKLLINHLSQCPILRILNLNGFNIDTEGSKLLAKALPTFKTLRSLSLNGVPFSGYGIREMFRNLLRCQICRLFLRSLPDKPIDDESIGVLTDSLKNPACKLRYLDITSSTQVISLDIFNEFVDAIVEAIIFRKNRIDIVADFEVWNSDNTAKVSYTNEQFQDLIEQRLLQRTQSLELVPGPCTAASISRGCS